MKKLLITLALSAAVPAFAQTAFTVNGQLVSAAEQKNLMSLLESQGVKDPKQQAEAAKNILTQQVVIAQEARKQKLPEEPMIKALLDERETNIFTNELIRKNAAAHPVTDKEIEKTYAELKKQYNPNEINVRHILVKTESEANDLIQQIKAGADMAALAKEKSLDTGSAANGGEIPFTNIRNIAIPGFAEASIGMKKGDILPIPFHSSLGYHIIKLEDKREVPMPELSKIKDQVTAIAARQKAREYLDNLRRSAKIEDVTPKGAKNTKKAK